MASSSNNNSRPSSHDGADAPPVKNDNNRRRCCRVFAIRHGESEWNVLIRQYPADEDRYLDRMYTPDCDITAPVGVEQSQKAGRDLMEEFSGDFLLVCSPLRRALQTARGMLSTCYTRCNAVRSAVHPAAAEVMLDACDIGTVPAMLKEEFPEFDFDLLLEQQEQQKQPYWWAFGRSREETWERMRLGRAEGKETQEMVSKRMETLRNFVRQQSVEHEAIVVVCHSETIWWLTSRLRRRHCGQQQQAAAAEVTDAPRAEDKQEEEDERLGIWTKNGEVLDITEFILPEDQDSSPVPSNMIHRMRSF